MIPEPQIAGDARARARLASKAGSSDQTSLPTTLIPRLQRVAVDAHPLDGARRRSLAARDLRALEGGTGRAGGGEQPAPWSRARSRRWCRRRPAAAPRRRGGGPRPGWPRRRRPRRGRRCRAGRAAGPGGRPTSMSVARASTGQVGGQRERRRAERSGIDAEQEVVHDRVADGDQVEHVGPLDGGLRVSSPTSSSTAGPHGLGQLLGGRRGSSSRTRPGSSDPHRSGSGGSSPPRSPPPRRRQVAQVPGDRGRADIDGHAVGACRRSPARRRR